MRQKAGRAMFAALAEHAARRAGELEVLVLAANREAHVARLGRDAGALEQLAESAGSCGR